MKHSVHIITIVNEPENKNHADIPEQYNDCIMIYGEEVRKVLVHGKKFKSDNMTMFCDGNSLNENTPFLFNKIGIYTCVTWSARFPLGAFYLTGRNQSQLLIFNAYGDNTVENALLFAEKNGHSEACFVEAETCDASLLDKCKRCEANGDIIFSSPQDYFHDLCDSMPDLPVVTGESAPPVQMSAEKNEELKAEMMHTVETLSAGRKLSAEDFDISQYVSVNCDNVKIDALKSCNDSSSDIIICLHETGEKDVCCELMFDLIDVGFRFDIEKNDIRTFRICGDTSQVKELCCI